MRKPFLLLSAIILLMPALIVKAQNYDDPGIYMKSISSIQTDFNKTYMAYISAAWHSNRAMKIEKLRQQVVDNLTTCRYKIIDLPYYKHDNSLRQSNIDYLWILTKVFNDDFTHLVNMEDLIDQSFDKMQLYLLFEEKINDTLKAANERIGEAEKDFATKYNVTLVSNKTDVAQKMEISNRVSKYRNKVYLLFFKCVWQESQVMEAIDKKTITKIEQARSALLNYATEGLTTLDTLSSFDNDPSLVEACRQSLTFYKKEAETEISKVSDFLLQEENFAKIKSSYDAKPQNSKTKQDTEAYNKALFDVNAGFTTASQAFKGIFADRNKMIVNWDKAEQKFIDAHMPYYR